MTCHRCRFVPVQFLLYLLSDQALLCSRCEEHEERVPDAAIEISPHEHLSLVMASFVGTPIGMA